MVCVDAETVQGDQVVPVALEGQEVPMVQEGQVGVHDGAGPSDGVPGHREPSERQEIGTGGTGSDEFDYPVDV